MRTLLVSIFVMLSAVSAFADNRFTGFVEDGNVVDGDSFTYEIRLWGVDTPESGQLCHNERRGCYRCGQDAKKALRNKIGDENVRCEHVNELTFGRNVAVCFLGSEEINLWLIKQGMGVAFTRFLNRFPERKPLYLAAEQDAKEAKRGIWSGTFIRPRKWRRGDRLEVCRGE